MVRPMVHSTKHYVQFSRGQVTTSSVGVLDIALAVESTVANLVDEVQEGSTIKAIYIELWLIDNGNDGSQVTALVKLPANVATVTYANMNALGTYTNKRNVWYVTQGLTPNDGVAQPVAVMRQFFKVPKSKQRMALGDSIRLVIANNSLQDLNFCGFATYKEYT